MREEEFRHRFRAALGEAPDERGAAQRAAVVLLPPAREERAGPPRAMAVVAGVLVVLVLVVLLGPRLLRAPGPRAAAPAAGAPAAGCRLPVVVTDGHAAASAPPVDPMRNFPTALPRYTAGFVSLATGRFAADQTAQGRDMPYSRIYLNAQWTPQSYDPVLERWLAASTHQVSPDQQSYVYVIQSPLATGKGSGFDTTTLHVYDVTAGRDRALWTSHDQIGPDATWEADGIHASTVPAGGGQVAYWLVDPVTGAVARTPQATPSFGQMASAMRDYGMNGGGGFGTDGAGRPILLDGSRNPGAHQEYFVGGSNGRRIVIHSGTMGDAFDFDPNGFTVDGDRLWAANYDATAVWLWTEKGGLKRYPLSGIAQHEMYVYARVVGPCV
jgi:hypothetical protein